MFDLTSLGVQAELTWCCTGLRLILLCLKTYNLYMSNDITIRRQQQQQQQQQQLTLQLQYRCCIFQNHRNVTTKKIHAKEESAFTELTRSFASAQ